VAADAGKIKSEANQVASRHNGSILIWPRKSTTRRCMFLKDMFLQLTHHKNGTPLHNRRGVLAMKGTVSFSFIYNSVYLQKIKR